MDIRGDQTTVVAEGSRSDDSGDSDIVLSQFLRQSTNVFYASGIERLMENDPVGFQGMLEEGESAIRAEQSFSQTEERVTFLIDFVQLETTGQTSTPLKGGDTSPGKRQNNGGEALLESGGPVRLLLSKSGTEVKRRAQRYRTEVDCW